MAAPAVSFVALQPSFSSAAPRFLPFLAVIRTGAPVAPFGLLSLNRNFQVRRNLSTRASSRPPPSQPSSEEDKNFFSGLQAMFSKAEDSLRIFFAVLFWMSLFFWGSAWEGRDDDRKRGLRKRK
ncbi:uncharacterized protein LOC110094285 [Dendrobium catenatum]|uniref:uncharacterized protein LOC110094285 n=1 Tax=Dendrobium catenatum TaxID=906689 RepID=UPI0009F34FAA|nr:uncharacterized protein LOC110094285 [Dendrobium catenatum]